MADVRFCLQDSLGVEGGRVRFMDLFIVMYLNWVGKLQMDMHSFLDPRRQNNGDKQF